MIRSLFTLALVFSLALPAQAEQTLVLNTAYTEPLTSPDHSGALDLFYKDLGRRLGINIEIQSLPAERCLVNANSGVDDGDVSRVAGLDQKYTELLRVPEAVIHIQLVAFSRNKNFTVNNGESFKPYSVGIVTGWKILEKNIVDTKSMDKVENAQELFSMLDKNRIDVAVYEKLQGLVTIQKYGYKNIKILQPSFIESDWYLYLNKKHAALVPQINAAIKAMKDDGTHKRIFDGVSKRYAL